MYAWTKQWMYKQTRTHMQYHTHTHFKKKYTYTDASIRLYSEPNVPQINSFFSFQEQNFMYAYTCICTHKHKRMSSYWHLNLSKLWFHSQIFKELLCDQCLSNLIFCWKIKMYFFRLWLDPQLTYNVDRLISPKHWLPSINPTNSIPSDTLNHSCKF